MTKLLLSNWMLFPICAATYLLATFAFWKSPSLPAHASSRVPPNRAGPSWDYQNPEADQLVSEMRLQKAALNRREKDLNELAARLDAQKLEVDAARESVQQLQSNFDRNVLRVGEEETANLKKLAKVYADMTPEAAAGIFASLDDAAVARILVFMKEPETAAILESLSKRGDAESKRAAVLSEKLRLASFRNPSAK